MLEFLSFCVTRHLHDGQESCYVGSKSDLFRKIWLSEQFLYNKNCYFMFLWQNTVVDVSVVSGRHVGAHPFFFGG